MRSYLLSQTHGRAVDQLRSEVARRRREERQARQTAHGGYDLEREVGDIIVADQVREVLGGFPTTSGARSNWPTFVVIPTGRWRRFSVSRKAP